MLARSDPRRRRPRWRPGIWSSGTAALTAPAPSGRRTLVGLESEPIGTRSAGGERALVRGPATVRDAARKVLARRVARVAGRTAAAAPFRQGGILPERPRGVGGRLLVPVVARAKAATLLITRSVVRNREFAIRIALGTTQGPPAVERLATSLGSA